MTFFSHVRELVVRRNPRVCIRSIFTNIHWVTGVFSEYDHCESSLTLPWESYLLHDTFLDPDSIQPLNELKMTQCRY